MHDYERAQLLERIERDGATVGASIPETVEIDGESIDLRAFVFETRQVESITPEERERVNDVIRTLRRARTEYTERLESTAISREEGEDLVETIVAIDRALHALADLEPADIESERQATASADRKRWMHFLRKVLGHEGDAGDRRARGNP